MLKRFFIIIILYLSALCLPAQNPDDSLLQVLEKLQQQSAENAVAPEEDYADESQDEESIDDTVLNIHSIIILPDSVMAWKNKKEFAYVKNLDSLLKALQDEEENKKPKDVSVPKSSFIDNIFNGPLLQLILWTMAAVFVLIILYQLAKNKGFFKSSVSKKIQEEEVPAEENVLEQNFDQLLSKAFNQGDYRLATRYHFLKTLQVLKDRELIDFAADKTNSRYVHEVPQQWRNDFANLILNYEYVWYGKFALSADQYNILQKKYSSFNEKIK